MSLHVTCTLKQVVAGWSYSLEPGTPPPRTIITYVKREEGESLVYLDHVLDIDDVFWTWFRNSSHLHPRTRTRTERSVKTKILY